MAIRGVEERLAYFKANPPKTAGWCALKVMEALGAPKQGLPDATAVANVVIKAGHMRSGRAPRGALVYWVGGHGHVCYALGNGTERSTDVKGAGTVGDVPFGWFERNWGHLEYVGWSWWFGGINTEPVAAAEVPAPKPARKGRTQSGKAVLWWDYSDKPAADQIVPATGKWIRIEGVDLAAPTVSGHEDHFLYLRLGLSWLDGATGPAYVETRWVRSDGDDTAYQREEYGTATTSAPYANLHVERGQKGVGGAWWIRCGGPGLGAVILTTRYAKTSVIAVA